MQLFDAKSFFAAEYDRAIVTGSLGTMRFYASDRKEIENLRARVLSYSRAKSRNHILETTLIDDNTLEIKYLGAL